MSIITETERTQLIANMTTLLKTYNYNPTETALNTIIDEWSAQKGELLEAFKKHPSYVDGKFLIAFTEEFNRPADQHVALNLYSWFNKTYGPLGSMVDTLPEEVNAERVLQNREYLPEELQNFFFRFIQDSSTTISRNESDTINALLPGKIHAHDGEKRTRVLNRICTYLNYSKHPEYNRRFAEYSDAMTSKLMKRKIVLSLNPISYLTMSFGNSWSSCQTIDKTNKRRMENGYEGRYCSGTMSYMLDPSTMVFYILDPGDDELDAPKIQRQLFHYSNKMLVQGRLYPQCNDYQSTELYNAYRNIVTTAMSTIFEYDNSWQTKGGTSAICDYVRTKGTHYADYLHFSNCTISFAGERTAAITNMIIGAEPMCIHCGERFDDSHHLDCCYLHRGQKRCKICRCWHDESDMRQIDGEWYCDCCVYYCKSCRTWHVRGEGEVHVENYGTVCPKCKENTKKFAVCGHCGNLAFTKHMKHVKHTNEDVCSSCICTYYTKCSICGEYFRNSVRKRFYGGAMGCPDCHAKYDNATKDDAEEGTESESEEQDEEEAGTVKYAYISTSTDTTRYSTSTTYDFFRW